MSVVRYPLPPSLDYEPIMSEKEWIQKGLSASNYNAYSNPENLMSSTLFIQEETKKRFFGLIKRTVFSIYVDWRTNQNGIIIMANGILLGTFDNRDDAAKIIATFVLYGAKVNPETRKYKPILSFRFE